MRLAIVFTLTLLSQACVNHIEVAKKSLEHDVITYNAISYGDVKRYPGNVVCGEYTTNSKRRKGTFRPFIYRASVGVTDARPLVNDIQVFCSEDPIASLYTVLGINFSGEYIATVLSIQNDHRKLAAALEQYESDNYWPPKTNQGLEALIYPTQIEPKPVSFREGGYLSELPIDPWGRAYLYSGPAFAGVKGEFIIMTLGADGTEGGKDNYADIGTPQMKYIDHVEQL